MSYQVLARKWRPRTFKEMVGQEHVVRTLVNALDHDRLHHAFLFTGTRGVGKTTVARILAKALNCERGVTSNPCGTCSACREIDEGRFIDLMEIDAASRTKVEDTRELLENVQYAATRGRYKVYLIDEVHMLSTHSFNALLKTLEEPPPHVKFLLATTDPQRLPVTILSRCLQFNLRRLSVSLIADRLDAILETEAIERDRPALELIARAGDGSMRDALSLLDQAIAFGGGRLSLAEVRDMLGSIDQRQVLELLQALAAGEAEAVLNRVAELDLGAPDYEAALAELITLLQRIALVQAVPEAVDDSAIDPEELRRLAALLKPEDVQLFYQIALIGRRDLPLSPEPRSGFEMVLLRMLCFQPVAERPAPTTAAKAPAERKAPAASLSSMPASVSDTVPKPAAEESGSATIAKAPAEHKAPAASLSPSPGVVSDEVSEPVAKPPAATAETGWNAIVPRLGLTGMAQQLALNCVLQERDGAVLRLLLEPVHAQVRTKSAEERLQKALEVYYGQPMRLEIRVAEPSVATPAREQTQRQLEHQQAATETIAQDPNVQALCETFNARVNPDSVEPTD